MLLLTDVACRSSFQSHRELTVTTARNSRESCRTRRGTHRKATFLRDGYVTLPRCRRSCPLSTTSSPSWKNFPRSGAWLHPTRGDLVSGKHPLLYSLLDWWQGLYFNKSSGPHSRTCTVLNCHATKAGYHARALVHRIGLVFGAQSRCLLVDRPSR